MSEQASKLKFRHGETSTVQVRCMQLGRNDDTKIPYDLTDCTVTLSVRKRPGDAVLLTKAGTRALDLGPEYVEVELTTSDMEKLEPGDYLYSLKLVKGTNTYYLVPAGPVTVEATI